ncbi:MAG: type I glyceraldehyde-3-phosphate dehydrogenase [Dehalococcoidia bacterium]
MTFTVGINGFGRIGRQVFKAILDRYPDDLEVVAVNDLTSPETNAHLLKFDSTYGRFPGEVDSDSDGLIVNGKKVKVVSERDPAKIPWGDMGVDIVVESTGIFTDASKAAGHLKGGAKKVIISAPASGEDKTIVLGVNDDTYDPINHNIISNASCTTNCIAPVAKVINDRFEIKKGLMSTIHAYTNDQNILDQVHGDLRRARTAAANIVPTSTGAARAVGLALPELKGRIHGMAYRVPTTTVSIVDFTAEISGSTSVEEINQAFLDAASNHLNGILDYSDEPLVSSDYRGDPHSAILDSLSTMVIEDNMVKVVAWYDNEWGYSCRVADLVVFVGNKGI